MSEATDYYAIPYPLASDDAEGDAQMQGIAERVEAILRAGFTVPDGSVTIGNPAVAAGPSAVVQGLLGTDLFTSTLALTSGGSGGLVLTVVKNGTEVNRLHVAQDGSVQVRAGNVYRPVPFAIATGSAPVTLTAQASTSAVINLPAGRFVSPAQPLVYATVYAGSNYYAYGLATSITSITVGVTHRDNTAGTANFYVHWMAVQMLPTVAPGLLAVEPEYTHHTTCHTEGCDNARIPIPVVLDAPTVICGVCSQVVDDIVPITET